MACEETERQELREEVQQFRKQVFKKSMQKDAEIRALRKRQLELEQEVDRHKLLQRAQQTRNQELQAKLDEYRAIVDKHKAKVRDVQADMRAHVEAERGEATRNLQRLQDEMKGLQEKLDSATAAASEWQRKFDSATAAASEWQRKFDSATATASEVQRNVDSATAAASEWQGKFDSATAGASEWQRKFDSATAAASEWQRKFETIASKWHAKAEEQEALKGRLADAQAEAGKWQNKFVSAALAASEWQKKYDEATRVDKERPDLAGEQAFEEPQGDNEQELFDWLERLDGGQGGPLQYFGAIKGGFETLAQIKSVRLDTPVGPGNLGCIDPAFFDTMGIKTFGHRLIFAQGILALP